MISIKFFEKSFFIILIDFSLAVFFTKILVECAGMGEYAVGLSKQAISVYNLLLESKSLTALEIGKSLKIRRNHVYRVTKHLMESGLIDRIKGYPIKYIAKRINEARNNYSIYTGSWFSSLFNDQSRFNSTTDPVTGDNPFNMTFFQAREELMEQNIQDVNNTKFSAKYVITVNPNGIPNELMLAYKSAVERGIDLKICAQEYNKDNEHRFVGFKHIGVKIKLGKFIGWHIYLIDDYISYVSMFDQKNKVIQTGVRFVNRGINRELQGIFEKYWSEAVAV